MNADRRHQPRPSASERHDRSADPGGLESTTVPPDYFDALVASLIESPDPMPRLADAAARLPRRISVR